MPTADLPALLRQTDFMRLWGARVLGTAANQMLMVAVGWQMYDLTGSAWDLGLVGLYQFVPALALVLVAGHVADRFHRGRIVAASLGAQALVAAILLAAASGSWLSRELLLAVSVALGAARAFQMPAQQALLPLLVPVLMLPRAMAFGSAGLQAAIIGGPALGGAIYIAGAGAVYAACLALFALACALLLALRYAHVAPHREPASLRSLLAGIEYIFRRRIILGAVSLDLFAVLLGGATALLPMFAKDILHVGPAGLGVLRAAPAAGALLMSLALARWAIEHRAGVKLFFAVGVYGLAILVFGLSTDFALSAVALAVSGAADMVSIVVRQTLVQLETPDAMRGRVSAVNSIFIGASNQLGEFESGVTAQWWGPVASVVVGGAGTLLVAAAWLRLFPQLRERDRLAPD
ncbi:MAG TPA: MFS transporter [Burkholderiaceae bacterium]